MAMRRSDVLFRMSSRVERGALGWWQKRTEKGIGGKRAYVIQKEHENRKESIFLLFVELPLPS